MSDIVPSEFQMTDDADSVEIKVSEEMVEEIDEMTGGPESGYNGIPDFVSEAIRMKLDRMKASGDPAANAERQ